MDTPQVVPDDNHIVDVIMERIIALENKNVELIKRLQRQDTEIRGIFDVMSKLCFDDNNFVTKDEDLDFHRRVSILDTLRLWKEKQNAIAPYKIFISQKMEELKTKNANNPEYTKKMAMDDASRAWIIAKTRRG